MPAPSVLAQLLPDLPRWVEVRDLLLSGDCEITALQQQPELAFVLRDPEAGAVFVVGAPAAAAIRAALDPAVPGASLVAPMPQAQRLQALLPAWTRTRIRVHTLPNHERLPPAAEGRVAFIDPGRLHHLALPADLLAELKSGADYSPLAAAFVDDQPAAFCYSASLTETLWDVAIDTLPSYRRQGHAARCAAFMIRHMQDRGRQPVWQAVEENPASWGLAHKLGFVETDELAFFEPPHPAPAMR